MATHGLIFTIKANGLKWLNANDVHKSIFAKRALVKEWRFMAGIYARSNGIPHFEKAHVKAIIHRQSDGESDALNWADTIKPVIDGLTDAGCWDNDDNSRLTVDIRGGEPWPKSGIELIIVPCGPSRPEISPERKRHYRRARRKALALHELNAIVEALEVKKPTKGE